MYHTILVATDGSDHARQAERHAIDLARDHGGTLHVLAVVDRTIRDEPGLSTAELVTIQTADTYKDRLADVKQRAATAGVDVECTVSHGVPHERILEHADEIDADVVVLGAHGDHDAHVGGVGRKVRERSDREVRVVEAESRRTGRRGRQTR